MRIKIPLPDKAPVHETNIPILIGDLNYGNHLGNDRLLLLAQEARLRYFSSLGFSELDFFDNGLIMTDSAIQYLAQGLWGEEVTVKTWLQSVNDFSFDLFYELKKNEGRLLAKIKTGMAFYNYQEQKLTKATDAFKNYIRSINVSS